MTIFKDIKWLSYIECKATNQSNLKKCRKNFFVFLQEQKIKYKRFQIDKKHEFDYMNFIYNIGK